MIMASENKNTTARLQELSGSHYEIAEGQPDIRGWDIKDESGKRIGEVEELLFDEQSRKVRYIILDLEGNVLDLEPRDVLVPIGLAQLHKEDDDVILPGITADQLRSLPDYEKGNISPDLENGIRATFGGAALAGAAATVPGVNDNTDFYDHDHFNEDNLYRNRKQGDNENASIPVIKEELEIGKREVETGGIRLRTRIVENEVHENINLREEKVHVETIPVDRPATAADLREDTIEMTESKEVPVVSKEARVVEEISLNKEVTEREETVRDTVRNTEVDVEKTGKKDKKGKGKDRI
jgi:uncharacterized protein (TIGR02271 family)